MASYETQAAQAAALEKLQPFGPTLSHAVTDFGPIPNDALAALIGAYAARFAHFEIAYELGVTSDQLVARLHQEAVRVVGVSHAREGDLILEWDGRPATLVVRRAFGPLPGGESRCLGIEHPSTSWVYNLWENSDIRDPDQAELLLLRARA